MSDLTFTPKITNTIFGERYYHLVTKRVMGVPGFAPEYKDFTVCDLVVSYREFDPYIQLFNNSPMIMIEDLEEIIEKMKKGFIKEDFKDFI